MKTTLIAIIALLEALLVALLLFLLQHEVLPDKTVVLLVWLLPISFGVHVVEEFAFPGGYDNWYRAYRPGYAVTATTTFFIKANAIAGMTATLLALGAVAFAGAYGYLGIYGWLVFLGVVAFNAIFHIRGAIETKQYCPGVVTGIVLYLPLAVISLICFLTAGVVGIVGAAACFLAGSLYQSVSDARRKLVLKKREQARFALK